jgi:hypothetical protein
MADVKKPPSVLDAASQRVRRGSFIMGLGFVALLLGSILAGYIHQRIGYRLEGTSFVLRWVVSRLLQRMWILGVLPLAAYGVARIVPLKPWTTGIGAALTGEVLLGVLNVLATGGEMTVADGVTTVVTLAGGVALTAWSVKRGIAAAAAVTETRVRAAEAKKSEYDAFAKEAQRLAERNAGEPAKPESAPPDPGKPPTPSS